MRGGGDRVVGLRGVAKRHGRAHRWVLRDVDLDVRPASTIELQRRPARAIGHDAVGIGVELGRRRRPDLGVGDARRRYEPDRDDHLPRLRARRHVLRDGAAELDDDGVGHRDVRLGAVHDILAGRLPLDRKLRRRRRQRRGRPDRVLGRGRGGRRQGHAERHDRGRVGRDGRRCRPRRKREPQRPSDVLHVRVRPVAVVRLDQRGAERRPRIRRRAGERLADRSVGGHDVLLPDRRDERPGHPLRDRLVVPHHGRDAAGADRPDAGRNGEHEHDGEPRRAGQPERAEHGVHVRVRHDDELRRDQRCRPARRRRRRRTGQRKPQRPDARHHVLLPRRGDERHGHDRRVGAERHDRSPAARRS
jgi:hypothetical protein